jgi:4-diphosphocytidyl-2-C-methyl-D-erythritol kinase
MLLFPNAKINLGLHVLNKRPDGLHNIESVFYPVFWCDVLEVIEGKNRRVSLEIEQSGLKIDGAPETNIIYKAWQLISAEKKLPAIRVYLHKNIPMGAGLGGGSSDAAHFINLLNEQFELGYTVVQKISLASQLGSDCAFFINNKTIIASGKGDQMDSISIDLSNYYILLVYPAIHCDTKMAYQGLSLKQPANQLRSVIEENNLQEWRNLLINDFEESIFVKFPVIKDLKQKLYDSGAIYASLSGSGSTVFGIFDKEPNIVFPANYKSFLQIPTQKVF